MCGSITSKWLDATGKPVEPVPYVPVTERCLGCETAAEEREKFDSKYRPHVKVRLIPNLDKGDD